MPGTKRLAVTGPWHGQMIEPTSDDYTTITAKVEPAGRVTGLVLPGQEPAPAAVTEIPYIPVSYPIPIVNGVAAMPLLVPAESTPVLAAEVLDALVLVAFGTVAR